MLGSGLIWAELAGDGTPDLDSAVLVGLIEPLPDRGRDHGGLPLGHMGERVAHPMTASAPPRRLENSRFDGCRCMTRCGV